MAKDPRFDAGKDTGADWPRKIDAVGRGGDLAKRKAFFQESAERNQYAHGVVIEKSPSAREE